MVSITVTEPLNLAINSNEPVVDQFLQKFQVSMTTKLKNFAGSFEFTTYSLDPAQYSSILGILYNQFKYQKNLLDTIEIRMAPQVYDAVGIQPGALGIGIRAKP